MIDRAELHDAARRVFGDGGLTPDPAASWRQIADMGWLMMTVPEDQGGLGLDRAAEGAIHYEIGRALVPGPLIAQLLVISALSEAAPFAARDDLLGRAVAGEVMTTSLALNDPLAAIPDADRARQLLIVTSERISLLPLDARGVTHAPRPTWDEGRRLFDVTADDSGAALVIASGDAARALGSRLQAQTLFALAADSLGGADALLALTTNYLKTRRQFDRPLAMFQALKHRTADLKTALAAAQALLWARADASTSLIEMGALKAHACRVYAGIAEEAVQLHGGIGLTSEYHCHRFLKRALLNAALGGDGDYWDELTGRRALAAAD